MSWRWVFFAVTLSFVSNVIVGILIGRHVRLLRYISDVYARHASECVDLLFVLQPFLPLQMQRLSIDVVRRHTIDLSHLSDLLDGRIGRPAPPEPPAPPPAPESQSVH